MIMAQWYCKKCNIVIAEPDDGTCYHCCTRVSHQKTANIDEISEFVAKWIETNSPLRENDCVERIQALFPQYHINDDVIGDIMGEVMDANREVLWNAEDRSWDFVLEQWDANEDIPECYQNNFF
jgi:hypothetical protein